MRNLFSAALKGNYALERGILTGVLRISKDSMLSGLNNLVTYSILDNEYSSHFGFSDDETKDLFIRRNLLIDFDHIRHWYNGYKSGDLVVYNPWSIISCINKEGRFDVYWVNTGNNDLIKEALFRSSSGVKSKFEQLMQGQSIHVKIDRYLSFDMLEKDETSLWSLLLFAGYLKSEISSLRPGSDLYDCQVSIPNDEIFRLYNRFFEEWLSGKFSTEDQYDSFLNHLVAGNVPLFMRSLGDYLLQSVSCFDVPDRKQSEDFYHGFVLAMLASLRATHYVKSNRESGFGRYDVLLIPKTAHNPTSILLEFKHVRKEEGLESSAKLALQQIQNQAYRTELLAYSYVRKVVEVGISFSGKAAIAAYVVYDLLDKSASMVQLTSKYSDEA